MLTTNAKTTPKRLLLAMLAATLLTNSGCGLLSGLVSQLDTTATALASTSTRLDQNLDEEFLSTLKTNLTQASGDLTQVGADARKASRNFAEVSQDAKSLATGAKAKAKAWGILPGDGAPGTDTPGASTSAPSSPSALQIAGKFLGWK